MATKQRVQVRDLADAPRLQATIQSGGNYNVAVQQAGDNKMLQLARSLEMVNPMLRDYGSIQSMDVQGYEDELARLSPEELKKKLSQSEEALDKEVRKGSIPFLGSPLNLKRKKRALGKAAHDQFLQSLVSAEGRLNVPVEGDSDKTTAVIINEEFEKFVEDNPALQGQFAREGFQEAVNPTILNLTRQYDTQKAKQAQTELGVEAVNSMVRIAKNIHTRDDFSVSMSNTDALESWNDINALQPSQQRAVISSTIKSLARVDPLKARKFLNWAKSELKVGNALYGKNEAHTIEMEELIEDISDQEEKDNDKLRSEFIKDEAGALKIALTKLNRSGEVVLDGETVTDKNRLSDIFKDRTLELSDISEGDRGAILESYDDIIKDELGSAEEITKDRILRKAVDADPREVRRSVFQELQSVIALEQTPEEVTSDPRFVDLARKHSMVVSEKIRNKLPSLLKYDIDEASSMLNEYALKVTEGSHAEFKDSVVRLAQKIEKEQEGVKVDQQPTTKDPVRFGGLNTVAPDSDEALPKPDWWYFSNAGKSDDLLEKANVWYSVVGSKDPRSDQAKKLIQEHIPQLANEFAKMALMPSQFRHVDTEIGLKKRFFEVARFMDDVFTLDVLENLDNNGFATTYAGIKFKPKELIGQENARVFVLLSDAQVKTREEPETIKEIERIIKAVDYKGSRQDFIREQEELRKKIVTSFKPLKLTFNQRQEEEEVRLIEELEATSDIDYIDIETLLK